MANPGPTHGARDLVRTQLQPLLHAQLRRLRQRYFWHGLSKALLWATALILLFFALDRWLRLPTPIRLLHTLATVAVAGYALLHFVRYPLSRRFTENDLAQWLEHTYPELHQRLISAVQLHALPDDARRNQSPAMIEQLWTETVERTRTLRLDALFDNHNLWRVLAGAALLLVTLGAGAANAPDSARAFVLRHLGFDADYPRDTRLVVELPEAGAELQRVDDGATTTLTVPTGADLLVSVLALGVVPKEVALQVEPLVPETGAQVSGPRRQVPMTQRPGDRFRHVFRRITGSFRFHASGGDDDRGDRTVIVRTVRPAQVANLAASVAPPAYTGQSASEQNGGAIEGLLGSDVKLEVTATAPVREATMVFLETGRRLPLDATAVTDDSGVSTRFAGSFAIDANDRYQIELLAENGLRNPNPGTYPISAVQDYSPVGRWLLPEDDAMTLLPDGILCLRLESHDDFGLTDVLLRIERGGEVVREQQLLAEATGGDGAAAQPIRDALPTHLFEVRELLADATTGTDGLFALVTLRDNRAPEAGTAELPRRIVQIVEPPELAAVIGGTFRRLREDISQASDIQSDREAMLGALMTRLADAPGAVANGELQQLLTGAEVGQGRIASTLKRVHLGLMRAFDLHLWNRLETSQHAATVVELYRAHAANLREPLAYDPAFYRDLLARQRAGTLGTMETTLDPILQMIEIADGLTTNESPAVLRHLAEAQVARDAADRHARVQDAHAMQQRIAAALQQLLLRLEEWNDYQDLVQEVRALRDRQRDLQNRTEEARGK